jgi:hypothetical protein
VRTVEDLALRGIGTLYEAVSSAQSAAQSNDESPQYIARIARITDDLDNAQSEVYQAVQRAAAALAKL